MAAGEMELETRNDLADRSRKVLLFSSSLGLLAAFAAMLGLIGRDIPLRGDEPVYAARGLGIGVVWPGYRAPGLPVFAALIGSDSTQALRLISVVSCLFLAVVTGLLAWRISGQTLAGWVAAAIVAAAPGVIQSSIWFLPDLLGAALTGLAFLVIVMASEGDRLRWWSLLAVPVTLVANYTRFAASIAIGAGVVALAVERRSVFFRPRAMVVALAVGLLIVTGVANFLPQPGSDDVQSAWSANRELAGVKSESLSVRSRSLIISAASMSGIDRRTSGATPAGLLFGVGLAAGLGLAVWRWESTRMFLTWAGLTVLGYTLTLGHLEVRYLVPAMIPLSCAAAMAYVDAFRGRQTLLGASLAAVLLAGVLFGVDRSIWLQDEEGEAQVALTEAGHFIRDRTRGPCVVRGERSDAVSPNPEAYTRLAAVALASRCDLDPTARKAFVVTVIPVDEPTPSGALWDESYSFFDDESGRMVSERIVVYMDQGTP